MKSEELEPAIRAGTHTMDELSAKLKSMSGAEVMRNIMREGFAEIEIEIPNNEGEISHEKQQ